MISACCSIEKYMRRRPAPEVITKRAAFAKVPAKPPKGAKKERNEVATNEGKPNASWFLSSGCLNYAKCLHYDETPSVFVPVIGEGIDITIGAFVGPSMRGEAQAGHTCTDNVITAATIN